MRTSLKVLTLLGLTTLGPMSTTKANNSMLADIQSLEYDYARELESQNGLVSLAPGESDYKVGYKELLAQMTNLLEYQAIMTTTLVNLSFKLREMDAKHWLDFVPQLSCQGTYKMHPTDQVNGHPVWDMIEPNDSRFLIFKGNWQCQDSQLRNEIITSEMQTPEGLCSSENQETDIIQTQWELSEVRGYGKDYMALLINKASSFQLQMMTLGPLSGMISKEIKELEEYLEGSDQPKMDSTQTDEDLAKLTMMKLQNMFQMIEDQSQILQQSEVMKKVRKFHKTIKDSKAAANELARLKLELINLKLDMSDQKKLILVLTKPRKPQFIHVDQVCDHQDSPQQCIDAFNAFIQAEKVAMESHLNSHQIDLAQAEQYLKKYNQLSQSVKILEAKIKAIKITDEETLQQLEPHAFEMEIFIKLNKLQKLFKEVNHDYQNLTTDQNSPQSDVIDVSMDEYALIKKYGENTANMQDTLFKEEIIEGMRLAEQAHDCAQKVVQNMIYESSYKKQHHLPSYCRRYQ